MTDDSKPFAKMPPPGSSRQQILEFFRDQATAQPVDGHVVPIDGNQPHEHVWLARSQIWLNGGLDQEQIKNLAHRQAVRPVVDRSGSVPVSEMRLVGGASRADHWSMRSYVPPVRGPNAVGDVSDDGAADVAKEPVSHSR